MRYIAVMILVTMMGCGPSNVVIDELPVTDSECAVFGAKIYALKLAGRKVFWKINGQLREITMEQAREMYLDGGAPISSHDKLTSEESLQIDKAYRKLHIEEKSDIDP